MFRGVDTESCSAAATEAVSVLSDKIGAIGIAGILLVLLFIMMPRGKKK